MNIIEAFKGMNDRIEELMEEVYQGSFREGASILCPKCQSWEFLVLKDEGRCGRCSTVLLSWELCPVGAL